MKEYFDSFSPLDYRYSVEELRPYLSEEAFIKYKLNVEIALIKTLAQYNFIPKEISDEIIKVKDKISAQEVYEEENRIKHDIRALVNCIRRKVSDRAKPYVHLFATSYDIVDNANVLRYKDATYKVILPDMIKLEEIWMELALKYKDVLQIGRTHGQHAEPITFGFAIALYVERWGNRILRLNEVTQNLVGKFSGAVGSYNATALFFDNPEKFEEDLLNNLGLKPAKISTQIIPPEPITDFIHTIISSFGILANFADDMRHLQRTEIAEITEEFAENQVGSSTMPQKRNPINFENIKSMWKAFVPRMITIYMDQISEHQRDLTNSCSQRFIPEILIGFSSSLKRMIKVCSRLKIDEENIHRNFKISQGLLIAEPLYIILASQGHPDAHEYIRKLTQKAIEEKKSLYDIVREDTVLKTYLDRLNSHQKKILLNPTEYSGIASKKAKKIVSFWKKEINKKKFFEK